MNRTINNLLLTVNLSLTPFLLDAATSNTPNVIFILSDDQSWYDYSFMYRAETEKAALDANPSIKQVAKTPAVDRLADEGLTYTHGYATPLCRPSLASIATGTYPHQNWVVGNDMAVGNDLEVERRMQIVHPLAHTLATRLGYTSFQTGKWWEGHHTNGGFTAGDTANSGSTSAAPPQYTGSKPGYVGGGRHGDWGLMTGRVDYVNDIPAPAHPIPYANTVQTVTDFIDAQVMAGKPFYIWYAPFLPHTPHDPPAGLMAEYTALGLNDTDAKYYANVERFDGGVGAILDELDAQGITDNTIVILICDNGRAMSRGKNTPYEGGIRTPIIVRWPDRIKVGGSIEPQIITSPASLIDMVPTIHHALNIPVYPEMTGVNLLDPDAVAARSTVFTTDYEHDIQVLGKPTTSLQSQIAIRDGWKLILYPNGNKELYHLYNNTTGAPVDPFEKTNLSASNPTLVAELSTEINDWYSYTPGRVISHSEALSFVVANHDLLQTSLDPTTPVSSSGDFTDVGGIAVTGEPALRDGVWNNDANGRGAAGAANGSSLTYYFDLNVSPLGYTINQIDLYSNWGPRQDRDEIKVSIDYALVSSPTNFDNHILISETYNPPTYSQAKTSVAEIDTSGIAAIRFTFPANQESGAVAYSEIDVIGVADGTAPSISGLLSLSPRDDATDVSGDKDLEARFCEPMQAGTGFVNLYESDGNLVESFNVATSPRVRFNGNRMIIDPTNNFLNGTSYYLQIDPTAVDDFSGGSFVGITDTASWNFTADGSPPLLSSLSPADNATEVSIYSQLSLNFNEAIQFGTGFIQIRQSGGTIVETFNVATSTQLNLSGPQLTIVPSAPLAGGSDYYIQIDATALTDLSGNSFAGILDSTSWNFSTDSTPPEMTQMTPANGSSGIPPNTHLVLYFDEAVQPGTGEITIRLASNNNLVQTVAVNSAAVTTNGSILTIDLPSDLPQLTSLFVNVPTGAIEDLSGNPWGGITNPSIWGFTTANAVQTVINSEAASFTVSSIDLLQTALSSINASNLSDAPSSGDIAFLAGFTPNGVDALIDGVWQNLGTQGRAAAMIQNGEFAEFTLDLSASPAGYTLDQIDLYSNWGSGQGRDEIRVTVSLALVGSPTTFNQQVVTNEVYNPPTQTQGKMSITNIGATGVAAIRFEWPASQENSGVGYSEIDVFGAAIPDNDFDAWISNPSYNLDPSDQGFGLDIDRDGVPNGLESWFGTHPGSFNHGMTNVSSDGTSISFSHPQNANPPEDVSVFYEWSLNLSDWYLGNGADGPVNGPTIQFVPTVIDGNASVIGTSTEPIPDLFLRMRASKN